jgi:DNA-binding NtrC family response regulator
MGKILVVDGDAQFLESCRQILKERGHEVSGEMSGLEIGIKIFKLGPDALVIDSRIDDIDGMDLIVEIQKAFPRLPIIIFSGHYVCKNDPRTLAANHYLSKSSGLSELTRKIELILGI